MTEKLTNTSELPSNNLIDGKRHLTPCKRTLMRTYELDICLPPLNEVAWEVVHSIECANIAVADVSQVDYLVEKHDDDGAILIDSDETLDVPLAEWLAVGCQRIRWHNVENDEPLPGRVCGVYNTNGATVFGGANTEVEPHGPAVFVGEIILPIGVQRALFDYGSDDGKRAGIELAIQFILAHELVHVIDNLKSLVPAFMDWRKFWKEVLQEGERNDLLVSRMFHKSTFIDDYGGENELAMIKHYWPSRADEWFGARDFLELFTNQAEC